jgi:hypothetical protein
MVPDGLVRVFIYFESPITEIKSETFLVDFGILISSVGGSLGLFLGFSCFTTLAMVSDFALKKLSHSY